MSYQGQTPTGYNNNGYQQLPPDQNPYQQSTGYNVPPQQTQPSPQPQGYPQQPGYPPQQPGYPQHQTGYQPQQAYPPQQGYPPQQPYGSYQAQQQVNINVTPGQNPAYSSPAFLRAQSIMLNEFCGIFDDIGICLLTFCIGSPCTFGLAYEASGQGSCIAGCCCYPCLCCSSRNHIQSLARVPQDGCLIACLIHYFCSGCASIQEYRAAKSLQAAGIVSPSVTM